MWWRASTSSDRGTRGAAFGVAVALVLAAASTSTPAAAQSCCAGVGAVQPARLAMHEDWLVGGRVASTYAIGSFDAAGAYHRLGDGASDLGFEESAFATVRLLARGQLTALVPFVETWRTSGALHELGGGIGDAQIAGRWDFTDAGRSAFPGVAALAGMTFPTGKAADESSRPLGTDATGVGAYQVNAGGAIEQTFGPWLVLAMGLATLRTARDASGVHSRLAPQLTTTAAVAYAFPDERAISLALSYAFEGDATIDGVTATSSARSAMTAALSAMTPIDDDLRAVATATVTPPIGGLGQNQLATVGLTLTMVGSFR